MDSQGCYAVAAYCATPAQDSIGQAMESKAFASGRVVESAGNISGDYYWLFDHLGIANEIAVKLHNCGAQVHMQNLALFNILECGI